MHSSIGLPRSTDPRTVAAAPIWPVPLVPRRFSAARFQSLLTRLEVLADFLTVVLAVMCAYAAYELRECLSTAPAQPVAGFIQSYVALQS